MKSFLIIITIFLILIEISLAENTIEICPPGIFGRPACDFPDLIDLLTDFTQLILELAPYVLVILIILGGLYYLISPFVDGNKIAKGHESIRWAIYGYVILLLISLVFSFIRAFLEGP